jgi:hypothetical protein
VDNGKCIEVWENLKGRSPFQKPRRRRRIMLKYILTKSDGYAYTGFIGFWTSFGKADEC